MLLSIAVLSTTGCGYLAKQKLRKAERRVAMFENLEPEVEDLQRGDPSSTFEIATRMDDWRGQYGATNDFPIAKRKELATRLTATVPRYLLAASKVAQTPALAFQVLTFRPYNTVCLLDEQPEVLAAARQYVDDAAAAQAQTFSGTYARFATIKGREQGNCVFATSPFGSGPNQNLTARVDETTKTYVRCDLPSSWKTAARYADKDSFMLFGRTLGNGQSIALPSGDATHVDFVLNKALFDARPSAENLHLSYKWKTGDDTVKLRRDVEVKVGTKRKSQRLGGGFLLWDP